MRLFYLIFFLFLTNFSLIALCSESHEHLVVEILEKIPLKNGHAILIIDDPAKTVFSSVKSLTSWHAGEILMIQDPYRIQEESMNILNVSNGETSSFKRLGACRGNLYEIKNIFVSPHGLGFIKVTLGTPLGLEGEESHRLFLRDKEAFLSNFHLDDLIYIVTTPDPLWPTFNELYRVYHDSWGVYSNKRSCLLNLNGACSEFYYSDISSGS